jgi:hypothetical protein
MKHGGHCGENGPTGKVRKSAHASQSGRQSKRNLGADVNVEGDPWSSFIHLHQSQLRGMTRAIEQNGEQKGTVLGVCNSLCEVGMERLGAQYSTCINDLIAPKH